MSISFHHGSPCSNITWGMNIVPLVAARDIVSSHRHDHHDHLTNKKAQFKVALKMHLKYTLLFLY
jgi:hypothetical protein